MGPFDRMRQAQPLANDAQITASPTEPTPQTPSTALLRRVFSSTMASVEARWYWIIETACIGVGVVVLSSLCLWATLTDRLSIEAVVVMTVVLILAMVTVSQGMRYHASNLSLQECARQSVAKTTLAAEIMMEFLREFTLKNQATISQMAESHKARVIDELRHIVGNLGQGMDDQRLRLELTQLEEAIAHKIMEIPAGVAFPLPRLEYFDQALHHIQEPERTPKCPACGAMQARVSELDGRKGIHYTCTRCGHKFSVGITVMIEKNA